MSIPDPSEGLSDALQKEARKMGLVEPAKLTVKITRGELATILREASIQAAEMISDNLSGATARSLESAMVGIGKLSNAMWQDINSQIMSGIKDAAELAVDQQFLREIQMGMPEGVMQKLLPGLQFNALQAANDILSRRTNGFTLSQRIYRNAQVGVMQVGKIVERGLALQLSAREIAAQTKAYFNPNVPGGASYAAMRLARTEINNAHHDTTIRVSKERPWVTGYKWNLSGSHPEPDICDAYAIVGDGSKSIGSGFFAKGKVPSKPHPQCLCFVTVAQESSEDFIRKLSDGHYDDYLNSQGVSDQEVPDEILEGQRAEEYLLALFDQSKGWLDYLQEHPGSREALESYVGSGYKWINGYLRGVINKQAVTKTILDYIRDLKRVFTDHKLERGIRGYRGIDGEDIPALLEALDAGEVVGSSFTDNGFTSISVGRKTAENFASTRSGRPILFDIDIPKGIKAIYLEDSVGVFGERELLLGHGVEIEITDVLPSHHDLAGRTIPVLKGRVILK